MVRYHEQLRHLSDGGQLAGTTTDYLESHALRTFDVLERYMLGIVPKGERNAGRLSIPYLTKAGTKAFKFRCVANHECHEVECVKYLLEGDVRIYNPDAFRDAGNVIGVCEGEVDAIVATTHLLPSIGIPGANSWTPNKAIWKFALRDFDDILVFADGDDAGMKFAREVVSDLGSKAYLVRCDTKTDVASMVAHGEADTLRERAGL
jgi:hypothetical protein